MYMILFVETQDGMRVTVKAQDNLLFAQVIARHRCVGSFNALHNSTRSDERKENGMSEFSLADNTVFGLYGTEELAEHAVDELTGRGQFRGEKITVLFPVNGRSRDFADRKGTRCPAGTAEGATAELPLDGTWGFRDPGAGPRQGALPKALAAMGVPPEWCHGRVKKGNVLVSVVCATYEDVIRATGILVLMAAEDISWSVRPPYYTSLLSA